MWEATIPKGWWLRKWSIQTEFIWFDFVPFPEPPGSQMRDGDESGMMRRRLPFDIHPDETTAEVIWQIPEDRDVLRVDSNLFEIAETYFKVVFSPVMTRPMTSNYLQHRFSPPSGTPQGPLRRIIQDQQYTRQSQVMHGRQTIMNMGMVTCAGATASSTVSVSTVHAGLPTYTYTVGGGTDIPCNLGITSVPAEGPLGSAEDHGQSLERVQMQVTTVDEAGASSQTVMVTSNRAQTRNQTVGPTVRSRPAEDMVRPVSAPPTEPTPLRDLPRIARKCTCNESNPAGVTGSSSSITRPRCVVHPAESNTAGGTRSSSSKSKPRCVVEPLDTRVRRTVDLQQPKNIVPEWLTINYAVDFETANRHYGAKTIPQFTFPADMEDTEKCNISHRHNLIIRNTLL